MSDAPNGYGFVHFGAPKYVGHWRFGELRIAQTRRPRWLTRVLMRWLLEWEWKDDSPC